MLIGLHTILYSKVTLSVRSRSFAAAALYRQKHGTRPMTIHDPFDRLEQTQQPPRNRSGRGYKLNYRAAPFNSFNTMPEFIIIVSSLFLPALPLQVPDRGSKGIPVPAVCNARRTHAKSHLYAYLHQEVRAGVWRCYQHRVCNPIYLNNLFGSGCGTFLGGWRFAVALPPWPWPGIIAGAQEIFFFLLGGGAPWRRRAASDGSRTNALLRAFCCRTAPQVM